MAQSIALIGLSQRSWSAVTAVLARMFLPGTPDAPPEGERARQFYVGRVIVDVMFILANLSLYVQLAKNPLVNHHRAAVAIGYIEATVVTDLVLATVFLRKPGRAYPYVLTLLNVADVITLVVWVQMTGTVSSYFIGTPGAFVLIFRLFFGYWSSFVTWIVVLVMYVGAFVLEEKGILRTASLFVDPPGGLYDATSFRQIAFNGTLIAYLGAFPMSNLLARLVTENREALRVARSQLRRAADQAQLGRLSGTLMGGFVVEDLLGRGGMGEVYAARRQKDGQEVAIKLLHAHLGDDMEMRARFRREAEVVGRMPAGTVAAVHEFGTNAEGYDYIVMERLRGEDLGALLRRRELLPLDEVIGIVEGVAEGLDAAHALGVIHRDLKPQNVFLVGEPGTNEAPDVRLLDFGVARLHEALATMSMTATAAVIGTPGYLAPEQAAGGELTGSADVFALGAIVYRALTGKPAFPSRNPAGALFEALHHDPPPPSTLVAGLSPDVDAVVALALAKSSVLRYQNASDLAADLAAAARGQLGDEVRARAAVLERGTPPPTATMTSV